jgi:nucleotide-binding universal stress UspA family protein
VDVDEQAGGPVVVGCDGSWHSESAVVAATHEAARRGVSLVLLAVADQRGSQPDRLSWVARHEAEAMQTALAVAKRGQWRAHHTDPSVATQVVAVTGPDAVELAVIADAAGLLVLGGHGGRGQLAFSVGSTSAELAGVFRCPFLLPHDRASRLKEPLDRHPAVVVGLEDLRRAVPVLAVATAEAAVRHAELVAVHAVHGSRVVDDDELGNAWRSARAAAESAAPPSRGSSRLVVTHEPSVEALVTRALPDDLLVVGTRGEGRLAGLVAGSVCRGVLDAMPCDVMVVPPALVAAGRATAPTGAATSEPALSPRTADHSDVLSGPRAP